MTPTDSVYFYESCVYLSSFSGRKEALALLKKWRPEGVELVASSTPIFFWDDYRLGIVGRYLSSSGNKNPLSRKRMLREMENVLRSALVSAYVRCGESLSIMSCSGVPIYDMFGLLDMEIIASKRSFIMLAEAPTVFLEASKKPEDSPYCDEYECRIELKKFAKEFSNRYINKMLATLEKTISANLEIKRSGLVKSSLASASGRYTRWSTLNREENYIVVRLLRPLEFKPKRNSNFDNSVIALIGDVIDLSIRTTKVNSVLWLKNGRILS